LCALSLTIGAISALREIIPELKHTNYSVNVMCRFQSEGASYKLFLTSSPELCLHSTNDTSLSWPDFSLCLFSMTQNLFQSLHEYSVSLFVFVFVFNMWICVRAFQKFTAEFCELKVNRHQNTKFFKVFELSSVGRHSPS